MCFFKILDCVLGEEVGTVYNKTRLMELLKVIIDSGIISVVIIIIIITIQNCHHYHCHQTIKELYSR